MKCLSKLVALTISFIILLLPLYGSHAATETFYVSNNGDGSAPETKGGAFDPDDFNNSANWDTDDQDDGKIGPNDDVVIIDDDGWIRWKPGGSNIFVVQQSGLPGKPITIKGESGGSPVVTTSYVMSGYSNYSGDIWVGDDTLTGASSVANLYFNSQASYGIWQENYGDLNAQGEFWFDNDNDKLYIYSASDPDSYYTDIEVCLKACAIRIWSKDYINVENLTIKYVGCHGIELDDVTNINITENELGWIGGGYSTGNLCRLGNAIQFWNRAQDTTVTYNLIYEVWDAAITSQGLGVSTKSDQHFRYNVIYNCEYGFEFWHRPDDSVVNGIYFENNTVVNSGDNWSYTQRTDTPRGADICFFMNQANSTTNVYIRNNIFYSPKDHWIFIDNYEWDGLGNVVFDYNQYYDTDSISDVILWKADSYSQAQFSTYQSEKSQDANSATGDPLMTNVSTQDFTLTGSSPCIDNGVNRGSSYDDGIEAGSSWPTSIATLDQDLYGSDWEIGAYVFSLMIMDASPANNDTGVSITVDLTWANPTGENTNDGYFKVGACPCEAGDSVWTNQAHKTSYDPGTLAYDTVHCWRVDIDHDGGTETGIDCEFTTTSESNPPAPPESLMVYEKHGLAGTWTRHGLRIGD